jgi:gas vesicle protein
MENNGGYGFVSGLFFGATLGAMAALLLAPKSGREVRADLYAGGERLKERASLRASDLIGRVKQRLRMPKAAEAADGVKRGAAAARRARRMEDGSFPSTSITTWRRPAGRVTAGARPSPFSSLRAAFNYCPFR